ncbi:MAG: response regulator [Acidobacteria bacterium]|nr:response regulator [Acidobacteriota bacterium]
MERFETQRFSSQEVAKLIAIFESERRFYDEIITLLPVALATVNAAGAVLSANHAFLREFGIRSGELEKTSLTTLLGDPSCPTALKSREMGILRTGEYTAQFTPIHRWERGEIEWIAVFLRETKPVQTPVDAPASSGAAPCPDPELVATAAAVDAAQKLAARVTHETNNLVMIASGYGREIMNQLPEGSPIREDISMMLGATGRIEAMAGQLNEFSRSGRSELASYKLHDLLPASGFHLPMEALETNVVTDRGALAAVFAALRLLTQEPLTIAAEVKPQEAVLTVKGFGMSAETLRQQFEALNKAAREGRPGARECALVGPKLAQAGIRWRVAEPGQLEMHVPRASNIPPANIRSALVVDDQSGIRAIVRRILEARGFQVSDAGSGEEAVSLLERRRDAFDLLITDMRMPGMTGRDLADRIRFRHPSTRILFISGFTDDPSVQSGILPEHSRFLAKPFHPEQLVEAINQLMG